MYRIQYFLGKAIKKSFLDHVTNNNNDDDLFEISDAQSTTALSVLYNSEYINGI